MTKPDEGEMIEDAAVAIDKTHLILKESSTWHISTMGDAKATFVIGTGEYVRIFPVMNFKKAIGPVLSACGDHW